MTNDRHQHKESHDNHIDHMEMMMKLRGEIKTLKRKSEEEIDAIRFENARMR